MVAGHGFEGRSLAGKEGAKWDSVIDRFGLFYLRMCVVLKWVCMYLPMYVCMYSTGGENMLSTGHNGNPGETARSPLAPPSSKEE